MEQLWLEPFTIEVGGEGYLQRNRERYLAYARVIEPDTTNWKHVWERLAFAILSANARFDNACAALQYATDRAWNGGVVRDFELTKFGGGITGNRAGHLNLLPKGVRALELTKRIGETWDEYRGRLAHSVVGLGLTKASFAACLLYPLRADVCCLDIWMLRALAEPMPRRWTYDNYVRLEDRVRVIALACNVNTFVAQWALWCWARGTDEDHNIFKGTKQRKKAA